MTMIFLVLVACPCEKDLHSRTFNTTTYSNGNEEDCLFDEENNVAPFNKTRFQIDDAVLHNSNKFQSLAYESADEKVNIDVEHEQLWTQGRFTFFYIRHMQTREIC